jgi:hypothetical protein
MLGVRREGVTAAALQLQRNGFIRYSRGHIRVLDRRGLEQHSCECYAVVEQAYEQLRSGSSAWSGSTVVPMQESFSHGHGMARSSPLQAAPARVTVG